MNTNDKKNPSDYDYQANNPNYTGYGDRKGNTDGFQKTEEAKEERQDPGRAKVNEGLKDYDEDFGKTKEA
jgi:hypothetical protein